jgi:hypothetical protein
MRAGVVPLRDYSSAVGVSWGLQGLFRLSELQHLLRGCTATTVRSSTSDDMNCCTTRLVVNARLFWHPESEGGGAAGGVQSSGCEPRQVATPSTAAAGVVLPPLAALAAPPRACPLLASLSPRLLVIDNWLEPKLCEELMAMAEPRLERSRVSAGEINRHPSHQQHLPVTELLLDHGSNLTHEKTDRLAEQEDHLPPACLPSWIPNQPCTSLLSVLQVPLPPVALRRECSSPVQLGSYLSSNRYKQ